MAKFNVDGIQNVEVSKKLPPQISPSEQLALMQRYTDTHRACADLSKEEREVRCLRVLYPALLRRMEPGDLFLDIEAGSYTPAEFEEKYLSPDYGPQADRYGKHD